ncbi:GAF domain-containing protein [Rhodobacterales bacterium HKCCE2091]|nr:GAF domain-containing protein [Rhodobacterales bacterium HKCCE2091]
MTMLCVDSIRPALEGAIASLIATTDTDGIPNVSMISQVHYVDPERVALSYQFFNKTRANLLATRRAIVQVMDPDTLAQYRLSLHYEETRTDGPLFESMKAKLSGIASHHGVSDVFRLLGSDVFRVEAIEAVPGPVRQRPAPPRAMVAAARRSFEAMSACAELDELFDCVTLCMEREFGIRWSMVLVAEGDTGRFYTVSSRGYPTSGVGAEVGAGEGVIGVAAAFDTPIRIGHMTRDYRYGETVRDAARETGVLAADPRRIPFPGLGAPRSQVAIPVRSEGHVAAVLFAEDDTILRFGYGEEDALVLIATHLGLLMAKLTGAEDDTAEVTPFAGGPEAAGRLELRYFAFDQSVFLGNEYLIKGVAGAILWRLLTEHHATGRTEFTTRELRIDPALRVVSHSENIDARLILLRKRLEERCTCLRIERVGRGRIRLVVARGLDLQEPGDGKSVA